MPGKNTKLWQHILVGAACLVEKKSSLKLSLSENEALVNLEALCSRCTGMSRLNLV